MIFLTQKAARRFNTPWKDLPQCDGDGWKVDVHMYYRTPLLLVTHSETLYTLVFRKKDVPTVDHLISEIKRLCEWFDFGDSPNIGKNTNRKLTGSMTDMKRMTDYQFVEYSEDFLREMQSQINDCPFSNLSYKSPKEALLFYVSNESKK